MKKTSLLVILSVVMVLAFTGCLFNEKEASLEILGKKVIAFGGSQEFEVKITSSSAGGVGDVFAKDVEVKSIKWDFENQTHSEGSFSKTLEGENAKKYTATFSTVPGQYRLTVTVVTSGDKTYEKEYNFEVVKAAPVYSIELFVGENPITWQNVQKNDQVEIKITLSDSQLSEAQVDAYEFKWEFVYSGSTDSSDFIQYGQSKTYEYTFTERAEYTVMLTVKDPFGETGTFTVGSFTISTTKPTVPEIVGTPKWTHDGSKFEIEVKKDEDVLYYVLEKKSSESDQFFFVYRAFSSSALTVKLFDHTVNDDRVTYRIYGVDGGQSQGNPLTITLEIPNRPPSKAVILTPSGVLRKVVFGNIPVNMFWTNGTDPDLGDNVYYSAYIGSTPESFDYLGRTQLTSIPISSKLVSGNRYYVRVDSSDGENVTRGDVYSFTFDPDINAPIIKDASIYMRNNPYQIDRLNYEHTNINMTEYTKTYEVEVSKFASFNDSKKFTKVLNGAINLPIDVPIYIGNPRDRLFIRMRIIYENQYMRITTSWSPATLMTNR